MSKKRNGKENAHLLSLESQRLQVELTRLAIEEARAKSERSFWTRHSGTIVAALMSAVLTVGGLIYVSRVNWNREDSFNSQRRDDLARSELRNVEYRASEETQQKREWDLKVAQFILNNQRILFKGKPEEQKLLARVIPTTFPQEVSMALLERLEETGTPTSRVIWRQARVRVQDKPQGESQESVPARSEAREITLARPSFGIYSSYPLDTASSPFKLSSSSLQLILNEGRDSDSLTRYLAPMSAKAVEMNSAGYRPINSSFVGDAGRLAYDIQSLTRASPIDVSRLTIGDPVVFAASSLPKQKIDISGTIVDTETGLPVEGAIVTLESGLVFLSGISDNTDSLGRFRIAREVESIFIPSALKVTITRAGYGRKVKDVPTIGGGFPISLASIPLERGASQ